MGKSRFLGTREGEDEDQLFQSTTNWRFNACVNFLHDDWDLYAEGYNRAGRILAE